MKAVKPVDGGAWKASFDQMVKYRDHEKDNARCWEREATEQRARAERAEADLRGALHHQDELRRCIGHAFDEHAKRRAERPAGEAKCKHPTYMRMGSSGTDGHITDRCGQCGETLTDIQMPPPVMPLLGSPPQPPATVKLLTNDDPLATLHACQQWNLKGNSLEARPGVTGDYMETQSVFYAARRDLARQAEAHAREMASLKARLAQFEQGKAAQRMRELEEAIERVRVEREGQRTRAKKAEQHEAQLAADLVAMHDRATAVEAEVARLKAGVEVEALTEAEIADIMACYHSTPDRWGLARHAAKRQAEKVRPRTELTEAEMNAVLDRWQRNYDRQPGETSTHQLMRQIEEARNAAERTAGEARRGG